MEMTWRIRAISGQAVTLPWASIIATEGGSRFPVSRSGAGRLTPPGGPGSSRRARATGEPGVGRQRQSADMAVDVGGLGWAGLGGGDPRPGDRRVDDAPLQPGVAAREH